MRLALRATIASAFVLLIAVGCTDGGPSALAPPATPGTRASPTAQAPPTEAIERPAPGSLLEPGYVLDQALDVSLDGSDAGQIVVLSHTVAEILQSGNPDVAAVPPRDGCPTAPGAEVEPFACVFRAEVFAYDPASGWARTFVSPPPPQPAGPAPKGVAYGHRGGIQGMEDARTFDLDPARQALVLTFSYCTGVGSGCGSYHEVVAARGGQIEVVYTAWQAGLTLEPDSASFNNPAFFNDDPFCCPSGRSIATVALDPATGDVGVVASELFVCTDGTFIPVEFPPNLFALRCDEDVPSTRYQVTAATAYEGVAGLAALRDGDRIRVEYVVEQCLEGQDCSWPRLIATKVMTVSP